MTNTKMWRVWVLCLFTLLLVEEAQLDKRSSMARRYCGSNLLNILQIVCNSNYYSNTSPTIFNQKKSLPDESWLQLLEESAEEEEPHFPFRSKARASSFAHRIFRRQSRSRGVVQECCYEKGCTINELRGYCGSSR